MLKFRHFPQSKHCKGGFYRLRETTFINSGFYIMETDNMYPNNLHGCSIYYLENDINFCVFRYLIDWLLRNRKYEENNI